jgi:UDP-N-acetylmuramoyl-L-alanyl-D-glutamate--2,6-diaminopimelate ligase
VVSESPAPNDLADRWIQVAHGRQALSLAARNFFQRPDERLLSPASPDQRQDDDGIPHRFGASRRRQNHRDDRSPSNITWRPRSQSGQHDSGITRSPASVRRFENAGGTHVTMEVSSHALTRARLRSPTSTPPYLPT